MAKLTPEQALAATVLELLAHPDPKRLEAARAGSVNSARVTIPWRILVELQDRFEAVYPGTLAEFRQELAKTPTPEGAP